MNILEGLSKNKKRPHSKVFLDSNKLKEDFFEANNFFTVAALFSVRVEAWKGNEVLSSLL